MLKFFRNIRKQSLIDQKVRKYILYAIGEILLVVIGILIALQVNNWNENEKIRTSSKSLFKDLYHEYADAGQHFSNSFEANNMYISFLENVLINW